MPIVRIPLTQGKFAVIDADDYHLVAAYKWHAVRTKCRHTSDQFYACRSIRPGGGSVCIGSSWTHPMALMLITLTETA
jgi:hypothetical protein